MWREELRPLAECQGPRLVLQAQTKQLCESTTISPT